VRSTARIGGASDPGTWPHQSLDRLPARRPAPVPALSAGAGRSARDDL